MEENYLRKTEMQTLFCIYKDKFILFVQRASGTTEISPYQNLLQVYFQYKTTSIYDVCTACTALNWTGSKVHHACGQIGICLASIE